MLPGDNCLASKCVSKFNIVSGDVGFSAPNLTVVRSRCVCGRMGSAPVAHMDFCVKYYCSQSNHPPRSIGLTIGPAKTAPTSIIPVLIQVFHKTFI